MEQEAIEHEETLNEALDEMGGEDALDKEATEAVEAAAEPEAVVSEDAEKTDCFGPGCAVMEAPDERCSRCNQHGDCWFEDGTPAATDDPAPETEPAPALTMEELQRQADAASHVPSTGYISTSTIDNEPRPPRDDAKREREQEQRQLDFLAQQAIEEAPSPDMEFEVILNMKQDGRIPICKPSEKPRNRILETVALALRTDSFRRALEGIAGPQVTPRMFAPQSYQLPVSISELRRENELLRKENDELAGINMTLKRKLDGDQNPPPEALQEAVAEVCEAIADRAEETPSTALGGAIADFAEGNGDGGCISPLEDFVPQTDEEAAAAAEASIAEEIEDKAAEADEVF
jgi:hypothetical protein